MDTERCWGGPYHFAHKPPVGGVSSLGKKSVGNIFKTSWWIRQPSRLGPNGWREGGRRSTHGVAVDEAAVSPGSVRAGGQLLPDVGGCRV